jgi:hypothetical protein
MTSLLHEHRMADWAEKLMPRRAGEERYVSHHALGAEEYAH